MNINFFENEELKNFDIYFYHEKILRKHANTIFDLTKEPKQENALLILTTGGGDLDAAFQIARRFQDKYKKSSVFIPSVCKSAGTLIVAGFDYLIMGDQAELGPLDVQILGLKEVSYKSGLNTDQTFQSVGSEITSKFISIAERLIREKIDGKLLYILDRDTIIKIAIFYPKKV